MTTVRRHNPSKSQGYGVRGELFQNADILRFGLEEILADIPYASSQEGSPEVLFTYAVINFTWRLKIKLLEADYSRLKTYNGSSGKSAFGEIVFGMGSYVSGDEFWSYDNWISAVNSCTFGIPLPYSGDVDLPCDEPATDLNNSFESLVGWYSGTSLQTPGISVAANAFHGNRFSRLASNASIFCRDSVIMYSWGVTYAYAITYFPEPDRQEYQPVAIYL